MLNDPTLSQPHCDDCGLPIRSESFELVSDTHRYEQSTKDGIITRYVDGIPYPIRRQVNEWRHDDPRGVRDHRPTPQEWGHTHDSDYERQERNWRMEQLEAKAHLGQQFK